MAGRRATLVAVLMVVLVACSVEAQPSPAQRASPPQSLTESSPAQTLGLRQPWRPDPHELRRLVTPTFDCNALGQASV